MPEKVGQYEPPKTKKEPKYIKVKKRNPAFDRAVNSAMGSGFDKKYSAVNYVRRQGISEFIEVDEIVPDPADKEPTIEEQQETAYQQMLQELGNYQDEEARRFDEQLAEAKRVDKERTRQYETLVTDMQDKLDIAEGKREESYKGFMSQLTDSFTIAEKARKKERKELDDKLELEKEQLEKEDEEKTRFNEMSSAMLIQKQKLRGGQVGKPTIKTSNLGLSMTSLLQRKPALLGA